MLAGLEDSVAELERFLLFGHSSSLLLFWDMALQHKNFMWEELHWVFKVLLKLDTITSDQFFSCFDTNATKTTEKVIKNEEEFIMWRKQFYQKGEATRSEKSTEYIWLSLLFVRNKIQIQSWIKQTIEQPNRVSTMKLKRMKRFEHVVRLHKWV